MAVELVAATFENRVGEAFSATPSEEPREQREFVLRRCDASPHARPDHPAFSLIFHAPGPVIVMQQIVTFEHPELGEFDLFVVPVGQVEDEIAYEAVIN
jgi:hypothetical protein